MTKHECRMPNGVPPVTCRGVCRGERLVNWTGAWRKHRYAAFTLIELIVVVGIITILAGLVLSTAGYARKKGALTRAETEIAAMSAACENYKADNGIYPTEATTTDTLNAQASGDPCGYRDASLYLYKQLSGDTNANFQPPAGARSYFAFKPNMLGTSATTTIDACGNTLTPTTVSYIRDPFGTIYVGGVPKSVGIYGYSTIQAAPGNSTKGYNPTFDLWSTASLTTAGQPTQADQNQWIKNW
jgi:type II secretory pathway pseudopilin PulG